MNKIKINIKLKEMRLLLKELECDIRLDYWIKFNKDLKKLSQIVEALKDLGIDIEVKNEYNIGYNILAYIKGTRDVRTMAVNL